MSKIVYAIQWLLIGAISSYDCYLSIKFQDMLYHNEMNPLGKMLIGWDQGGVALFMGMKFFSTILALGFLIFLYDKNREIARKVITPVLLFQIFLLLFLETN